MTRKEREEYKQWGPGYYHFCLDRLDKRWLFNSPEDYRMGMATVAIGQHKFGLKVLTFELMTNHLHEILHATGAQCVKLFSYYRRRFSEQFIKSGRPPLPKNYGFKLIPIEDDEALRSQILYTERNPYEKDYCVPGGHLWGSGYLLFNDLANVIRGTRIDAMNTVEVRRLTGTRDPLPPSWEIHPELGLLPNSFINPQDVMRLFSSPKDYLTRLVKEYETVVRIARSLDEEIEFSPEEVRDIVNTELRQTYPGRLFKSLSQEEKCRVAVKLNDTLGLTPEQLAPSLYLSQLTISQAVRSKDMGIKH